MTAFLLAGNKQTAAFQFHVFPHRVWTHLHSQINWRQSPRSGITVLHNDHIPTIHNYLRNPYTIFHNSFTCPKYICLQYISILQFSFCCALHLFQHSKSLLSRFPFNHEHFFQVMSNKLLKITCTETIQRKKSHQFSKDGQRITNPRKLSELINF